MPLLYRQRVLWQGFPGAPGISNFYFNQSPSGNSLFTMWASLKYELPNDVTLTIDSEGDAIDEDSGQAQSTWIGGTGGVIQGAGGDSGYAPASGAVINWLCGGARVNGRRVQGRTFIVPCKGNVYDASGSLLNTELALITQAANTFMNAEIGKFVIYHRPTVINNPATGVRSASGGKGHPVTACRVPDFGAVMRSRRG